MKEWLGFADNVSYTWAFETCGIADKEARLGIARRLVCLNGVQCHIGSASEVRIWRLTLQSGLE